MTSPDTPNRSRSLPATGEFARLWSVGLTARECEVLGWVSQGKRDAEIGRILGIATKTVGKHIEHLLAKLHAENRTAAINVARERLSALRGEEA